jgi:hypothetical protein
VAREVPHQVVGVINVVLLAVLFSLPLAGSQTSRGPAGDVYMMVWALSILPALVFSILYLVLYRRRSRFFAVVAWLTLVVGIGFQTFSFLMRG